MSWKWKLSAPFVLIVSFLSPIFTGDETIKQARHCLDFQPSDSISKQSVA